MDIKDLLKELKTGFIELSKIHLKNLVKDIESEASKKFDASKSKLEKWLVQVKNGELSQEDLRWLLESEKDLFKMEVIAQTAEAKISIDKFKDSVLKLIIQTVSKIIP